MMAWRSTRSQRSILRTRLELVRFFMGFLDINRDDLVGSFFLTTI
jgi:hypothetical protein